jgi:hypothetical protein
MIPAPLLKTSSIIPPVTGTVEFLHQFDGLNGALPDSPDETGKRTVTTQNTAALSTTAPIFGTASLGLGVGYAITELTEDLNVSGTVEWCLEGFLEMTIVTQPGGGFNDLIAVIDQSELGFLMGFGLESRIGSNTAYGLILRVRSNDSNENLNDFTSLTAFDGGVVYHVAYLRLVNNLIVCVDGVQVLNVPLNDPTITFTSTAKRLEMGVALEPDRSIKWDSVRLTIGGPRYTTFPFTPPTGPLGP